MRITKTQLRNIIKESKKLIREQAAGMPDWLIRHISEVANDFIQLDGPRANYAEGKDQFWDMLEAKSGAVVVQKIQSNPEWSELVMNEFMSHF